MRKKLKLIVSLSTFCLAIAVLCFGVFAAIKITYTVSGSISYEVTDAHVDIATTVYYSASQMTETELKSNISLIEEGTTSLNVLKTVHQISTTGQEYDYQDFSDSTSLADLKFDSTHKSYFFVVNVTNRGANNVWAIVNDDINDPANTIQINNGVQQTIAQNQTKPIIFALSLDDPTVSITSAEDTAFYYLIKVGVGDVSQQDFNLAKLDSTKLESGIAKSVNSNISGVIVIPSVYKNVSITLISSFSSCNKLTTLVIPNSVVSIESSSAFVGCKLSNVICNIQGTDYSLVNGKLTIKNMRLDSNPSDNYAARNPEWYNDGVNGLVTSVEFPANCTEIVDYAFYGCSSLKEISIPNSVENMGTWTFYNSGLQKITFSNKTESIGEWAFSNCLNLESVSIPSNIKSLGEYCFYACTNLSNVTFNHSPEEQTTLTIGYNAFDYTKSGAVANFANGVSWNDGINDPITGSVILTGLDSSTSGTTKTWTISKN